MKTIIAGSRDIEEFEIVYNAIELSGFVITEVVSGTAKGVDKLGERWAVINDVPIKAFPAKWDDLNVPNAVIKTNKFGKPYNARAGHVRNAEMVDYADSAIILWDGESKGTKNMIGLAKTSGLFTFVYYTSTNTYEYFNLPGLL